MLILEFNQFNHYKKYLNDTKFMKYFNELNNKLHTMYPTYTFNLELIIEQINSLYLEGYLIDDAINKLYYNGNLFTFSVSNGDA